MTTGTHRETGRDVFQSHVPKFKHLSIRRDKESPHVVIVALDRPAKRNAINSTMWREIGQAFSLLGRTGDKIRCILLTGKGKSFTAGIDVQDPSFFPAANDESDPAHRAMAFLPQITEMQECFSAVERLCPVPVVAAIHGNCIGAGVDLASCCDIRWCSPDARFSVREVRLGLAADVGTLQRMPKICGNESRVRELCLTGQDFSANEALRIGFVSRISDNLLGDALHLCREIASQSPVAIASTKKSLIYSRDHSVAEGLAHVALNNSIALMSHDLPEAFQAAATRSKAKYPDFPPYSKL